MNILARERAFFDYQAVNLSREELAIPTVAQVKRYREARPRAVNFVKDALFAMLQPLESKRVLDYGCGIGENACLLAACGARVTAFDLSPISIAQARRRAEMHGLSDRICFDVAVAGQTRYPPQSFDVIVGFRVLHHLHQHLPLIYAEIARLLAPGGTAYFIEPVANSRTLRNIRRCVPVRPDKTPDERQLHYSDFGPLRHYFSQVEFAYFSLLDRLSRFRIGRLGFLLRWLDYHAQRVLPALRRYFGTVIVSARQNGRNE
jgi:SAM-dependent methyltransferase